MSTSRSRESRRRSAKPRSPPATPTRTTHWPTASSTRSWASSRLPEATDAPSGAEDLLHRPALGELVHELVEVADLLHQRVLDLLDAHSADHACDQPSVRVQP